MEGEGRAVGDALATEMVIGRAVKETPATGAMGRAAGNQPAEAGPADHPLFRTFERPSADPAPRREEDQLGQPKAPGQEPAKGCPGRPMEFHME